jgi:hypothetical protein
MSPLTFLANNNGTNIFGMPVPDITKQTDSFSAVRLAIIQYVSKNTLQKVLNNPIIDPKNPKLLEMKAFPAMANETLSQFFLKTLSQNDALSFNKRIEKMLLDGDYLHLSSKEIYRLNVDNLSRYMAQHPEISPAELKDEKAYSMLTNWRYKSGFESRVQEAEKLLQTEISFSLLVYNYLKNTHLIRELAILVLGYLEREQSIIDRVNFEILKNEEPDVISDLEKIYSGVSPCFIHDKKYHTKYDEPSIILSYLAKNDTIPAVAIKNSKIAQASAMGFSLFGKKPIEKESISLNSYKTNPGNHP